MFAPVYWTRFVSTVAVLSAIPIAAQALPLSPAVHDSIEQQQKQRLQRARQQRETLQSSSSTLSLPEVSATTEAGPCFTINHIELHEATVISRAQRAEASRIPANGCLRLADIRQRIREITELYLSMGYITSSAWLPEQDIASGILRINVTEGRIESVTLDGQFEHALQMAFPNAVGQLLNLRDVEQGLEQLNRLASRPITIDILPGSRPGFSVLQLTSTEKRFPLSLHAGADNSGQKSTGERQLNGSLIADNLFRLADQWTLTVVHDGEFHTDRRSRSLQAGVTVPYGYWLFSAYYGWSDSYQPLMEGKWRYEGSVQTQRLAVNRTLWRDGQQRLVLEADLTRHQTENRLGDVRLDVSSPTLTSLTTGVSYSRTLFGGYLTFGPAYSQGLGIAGATDDRSASGLPPSDFRRFSLNGSWFYPLASTLSWFTSAYGQTTPDNLYASERLSVGGQYSVRGFKEQYLNGNRGGYWRNELTWQGPALGEMAVLSLTGALDVGYVAKQTGTVDGGTLSGASVALAFSRKRVTQSITVGVPLSWPGSLNPDKSVLYWQATFVL